MLIRSQVDLPHRPQACERVRAGYGDGRGRGRDGGQAAAEGAGYGQGREGRVEEEPLTYVAVVGWLDMLIKDVARTLKRRRFPRMTNRPGRFEGDEEESRGGNDRNERHTTFGLPFVLPPPNPRLVLRSAFYVLLRDLRCAGLPASSVCALLAGKSEPLYRTAVRN
jgi:hypothetical protein